MDQRPNILVVCGRNKKRSRTAEHIFKNDERINIRSAGLSSKGDVHLSEKDVSWADLIFVMEKGHQRRLHGTYQHLEIPPVEVLEVEDNYEYLDRELIEILHDRINHRLRERFLV